MKNLLVFGNRKLDHHVAIFDLPAIMTCPNHSMCWKTCYAAKQQKYWHLQSIREYRLKTSQEKSFVKRVILELEKAKICRPHSSGDFYSQKYVNKWTTIMKECPNVKFFLFTKTKKMFNFKTMESLSNVNVISSILPEGELNYDLPILLEILKSKYQLLPCSAPYPYVRGFCMGVCTRCLTEKMMLFPQHGR